MSGHKAENNKSENKKAQKSLKKDLDRADLDYSEQDGKWKGKKEKSFAVTGIKKDEAKELGQKYGQDAVMHSKIGKKLSNVIESLDSFFDGPKSKIISVSEPKEENFVLKLYRGFDVEIDKLRKEGRFYVLSPNKSEQGLIWFTHDYIRGYDPIEYVKDRGSHILTYHLKCKKHFEEVHWDDGSTSTRTPEHIDELTNPYEDCQFYMGIELPNGWVFSYKNEKFIGCSKELKIIPDMLQKSEDYKTTSSSW